MSGILTTAIGSWGAASDDVSITGQTISQIAPDPLDAYARYQLDSDGKVYKFTGTTAGTPTTYIEDWVDPNSSASNYECFATLTSGTLDTGTTGSWLALTSDHMWGVQQTSVGSKSASITVKIRKVGTTTDLTSALITLNAEVIT